MCHKLAFLGPRTTPHFQPQGLSKVEFVGAPRMSISPWGNQTVLRLLSPGVSEDDLRMLFGRFGDTVYTKIPPGKGCGFVQFVQRSAAEAAMGQMQVSHGTAAFAHMPLCEQRLTFVSQTCDPACLGLDYVELANVVMLFNLCCSS